MTEYKLTQTAKEDLDYECSECGETEYPDVIDREEPRSMLVDHRITVKCVNCGRESKSDVWDRDVKIVGEEQ